MGFKIHAGITLVGIFLCAFWILREGIKLVFCGQLLLVSCLFFLSIGFIQYYLETNAALDGSITWLLSDVSVWLYFLSFVLVSSSMWKSNVLKLSLVGLLLFMFFASVFSFLFCLRIGNSYEGPVVFITAGLPMYLALWYRLSPFYILGCVGCLIVGFLSLDSGFRTSFVFFLTSILFSGSLVLYLRLKKNQRQCGVLVLLLSAICLFVIAILYAYSPSFDFFQQMIARDASLVSRLNESSDVLANMQSGGAGSWIFGHGHGAYFIPIKSNMIHNVNSAGALHHIHNTFLVFLYRYGLLGVVFFSSACFYGLYVFVKSVFSLAQFDEEAKIRVTFGFILLCYLVSSILRNELSSPVFLFVLTVVLVSPTSRTNTRIEMVNGVEGR